jgi:nitroreductase
LRSARTYRRSADAWLPKPVSDDQIRAIHDLAKLGPTSANCSPARIALGLDCGPMSGFHNAGVDDLFFAGTAIKSNFLINIGCGNPAVIRPREERYAFDEACRIV